LTTQLVFEPAIDTKLAFRCGVHCEVNSLLSI
jgi:hypothetical protein